MSEKGGRGIKSSPKSKDGGKNGNSTRLEKGRKFDFDPKEQEAWVLALPFSQVIGKGKRSMKKRCKRVREDDDDDDDMTIAERFNISSRVDRYDDDDDTVLVKELPLSQVLEKSDDRMMNKRAREDDENAETDDDDDDNMTIAERFRSRKKRSDVESVKGEKSSLEVNNKVSDSAKGERSGLEVVNNVSDELEKLAFGDETVATQEIEQKNDENKTSKPSNGVAEQKEDDVVVDDTVATQEKEQKNDENNTSSGVGERQEDDVVAVDERLKQRKLVIWELALKLEERILKVENTLAKIKQWKLRQSQTTPPASA